MSPIRDDLSQVNSTLRRNPNGTKRRKGEASFQSILSAIHGWWLGVKRCLSTRAHTSNMWHFITHCSNSSLNTGGEEHTQKPVHFVQSCSSLNPTSTELPCASAPPTLQWINAFPCSARPVSKSLSPPCPRPTSSTKFRTSLAHTKFLPCWADDSNIY